jgi:hypothetical protein
LTVHCKAVAKYALPVLFAWDQLLLQVEFGFDLIVSTAQGHKVWSCKYRAIEGVISTEVAFDARFFPARSWAHTLLNRGLAFHGEVHGVGNEAKFVSLLMQLSGLIDIAISCYRNAGLQQNFCKVSTPVFGFNHFAYGVINIAGDDNRSFATEVEVPEHMAGR